MMLDYKKLLESLLRELIDKKIISEWYCNGAGYFWKYNEKDKRILKLEKENAELKGLKDVATLIRANNDTVVTLMQLNNKLVSKSQQLTKAKKLLAKWVELYKPKLEGYPITPIQEQTEQFIKEIEK